METKALKYLVLREMCPGESEECRVCKSCPFYGDDKCYYSMMESSNSYLRRFLETSCPEEPGFEVDLYSVITEMLHRLGVPSHLSGFGYVRRAISIVIEDPQAIDAITKTLYPQIAQEFHTTSSRTERAIRHAIETAWSRGDQDFQDEIFGWTVAGYKGKPTNSEFIATTADYIRLKYHGISKSE